MPAKVKTRVSENLNVGLYVFRLFCNLQKMGQGCRKKITNGNIYISIKMGIEYLIFKIRLYSDPKIKGSEIQVAKILTVQIQQTRCI